MIKKLFPGFRRAKRALESVRAHHHAAELKDMPASAMETINLASQKYYEAAGKIPYWQNKPFSDTEEAPWLLWRFGVLLAGLRLIPGIRILDFGCGTGWTSVMLAQMGAEVVGMDIAPRAMDIANSCADRILNSEQRSRCAFVTFPGAELPFQNASFDVVVLFETLHHLPNPVKLLGEFARVLGRHGRLGFAEPGLGHEGHEHSEEEMKHGILEQDLDIEQVYQAGISAGFRDLELLIQGIHPGMLSLNMEHARRFLRGASWLVPADFIRHSIITGPIGIFTKSHYASSTLNPSEHRATILPRTSEINSGPGQEFAIDVNVLNSSNTVWLSATERGRGLVTLGASLLAADQTMIARDYSRAHLPQDLAPGDSVDLKIQLRAPEKSGHYFVRFDMVNEGVCWFADKGSASIDLALSVS